MPFFRRSVLIRLSVGVLCASFVLACAPPGNPETTESAGNANLASSTPARDDWPLEGGDLARSRYAAGDLAPPFVSGSEYVVGGDTQYGSPVSISRGDMFVDGERKLQAVELNSGDERWHFNLAGSFTSPAIVGDQVFIRSEYDSEGFLYALRREDGAKLWQFKFPRLGSAYDNIGGHVTSPIVADDLVLAGASRLLYALDRTNGELVWEFAMKDPVASSVSVDGDMAYVADFSRIYSVDLASGEERWQFDHDTISLYFAPVLLDDTVIATGMARSTAWMPNRVTLDGRGHSRIHRSSQVQRQEIRSL